MKWLKSSIFVKWREYWIVLKISEIKTCNTESKIKRAAKIKKKHKPRREFLQMIPHKSEDEKAKKIILKGDSETYEWRSYKKYPRHEITRKNDSNRNN